MVAGIGIGTIDELQAFQRPKVLPVHVEFSEFGPCGAVLQLRTVGAHIKTSGLVGCYPGQPAEPVRFDTPRLVPRKDAAVSSESAFERRLQGADVVFADLLPGAVICHQ